MLRERHSENHSHNNNRTSINTKRKARYNLSNLVYDMRGSIISQPRSSHDFDISTDSIRIDNVAAASDSEDEEPYKNAHIIDFVVSDNEEETNDLNIFQTISKRESVRSNILQENTNIANMIISNNNININEKRIPLSPSSNNMSMHRHSSSLSQIGGQTTKRQSTHSNSSKRFSLLSFTNSSNSFSASATTTAAASVAEDKENKRFSISSNSSSSKKRFSTASLQSAVSSLHSTSNNSVNSSITSAKNNIVRSVRKRFSSISVVNVSNLDDDDVKTLKPKQSIANFRPATTSSNSAAATQVVNSDQVSIHSVTPSLRSQKSRFRLSSLFHKKDSNNTEDSESVRSLRGRNSLSDLRKSMMSFSPSANNLLRSLNRKDSIDRSMISMPKISDTETKENLKNKLKTSSSIISFNSVISSQTQKHPGSVHSYNFQCLQALMGLTNFNSVLKFNEVFIDDVKYSTLAKLSETPFTQIYQLNNQLVYKIIPFTFDSTTSDITNVEDTIQELKNILALNNTSGFVKVERSMVVKGEYPVKLLKLSNNSSDPNALSNFDEDQMYLIIEMEHGGIPLTQYPIQSWEIASDIFWKIANILADAEDRLQFEHRDLHWANIVIDSRLNVKLIDFASCRLRNNNKEDEIISTRRLDSQDFFKGKGDYQFEIYRLMRNTVQSQSQSQSSETASDAYTTTDWSIYCPQTNLLWLHYVLDKLINHKKIKAKDISFKNDLQKLFKCLSPINLETNNLRSTRDLINSFGKGNKLLSGKEK